jgi:small subunit ribosomal protein S8
MPHSRLKAAVAQILLQEGYLAGVETVDGDPQPTLRIQLKYRGERNRARRAINEIHLVSKPSRRVYVGREDIPQPLGGMGICVVSTSQGVLSGTEARTRGLGGEVLCEVW